MDCTQKYQGCSIHPSEIITHFCRDRTCNKGLCWICVSLHQEDHAQNSSKSILCNLSQITQEVQSLILTDMDNLQIYQEKLLKFTKQYQQNLKRSGEQNKDKLLSIVNQTKQMLKQLIDNTFDKLRRDLLLETENANLEIGEGILQKASALQDKIKYNFDQLEHINENISNKSSIFVKEITRYLSHFQHSEIFQQIRTFIEYKKMYKMDVTVRKTDQLQNLLKKFITVKFQTPSSSYPEKISLSERGLNTPRKFQENRTDSNLHQNILQMKRFLRFKQNLTEIKLSTFDNLSLPVAKRSLLDQSRILQPNENRSNKKNQRVRTHKKRQNKISLSQKMYDQYYQPSLR